MIDRVSSLRRSPYVDSLSPQDVVRVYKSMIVPCSHSHYGVCDSCLLLRISAYEDGVVCDTNDMSDIMSQCVLQLAWERLGLRSVENENCCCFRLRFSYSGIISLISKKNHSR